MATEIERKFLVKSDTDINSLGKTIRITQGYLSSVKERSVRIRIKGKKAYLTIKGIGNESGASRYEFEKEISPDDAKDLLKICEPGIISKTRTIVDFENNIFEIDQFSGDNEGLIIAEIELKTEDEEFKKPSWLGEEVTGNVKYYNSELTKNPYKNWK